MSHKILIVEDETVLLDAYAMVLNADGYDVSTAHDGEEALQICSHIEFDLILLDLRMPRVSGLEFLKRYQRSTKHPNVKIIVFSNLDADKDIDSAYSLGADKYVLKAWASPRELSKLVKETLQQKA
ncbi:MAG TPA: response regulator [Candidatus Saccharibacteria bacterium]|jgi:DNA-binding response OmpR family regulator|nr:response regulator [Candidatus Saccharibacteria bacterium]HMT55313.1 response regulator [Candidatus Saccharibacteria bacterium]